MSKQRIEYVVLPASKEFFESVRYSDAVKVGSMLYLSGQIGWIPETGNIVEGGLREQLRQAFSNMKAVIECAGGQIDDVVQLTSFFADKRSGRPMVEDFNVLAEVQREFFKTGRPAGVSVRVEDLAYPELLVELFAVAAL